MCDRRGNASRKPIRAEVEVLQRVEVPNALWDSTGKRIVRKIQITQRSHFCDFDGDASFDADSSQRQADDLAARGAAVANDSRPVVGAGVGVGHIPSALPLVISLHVSDARTVEEATQRRTGQIYEECGVRSWS